MRPVKSHGVAICRHPSYSVLMTQDDPWPKRLTEVTGRQVRKYRELRKISASELADNVGELMGGKYTRAQVTNLEASRRRTVTVGEIIALGAVLGVPPTFLVTPIGFEPVELLPGLGVDTWSAYQWFTGLGADSLFEDETFFQPRVEDVTPRLDAFRKHQSAVADLAVAVDMQRLDRADASTEHLIRVATNAVVARRDDIRGKGWHPPALPASVRDVVEASEKEQGR